MAIIQTVKAMQAFREDVIFIDVRTKTAAFTSGIAAFEHSHIPNAVFIDMKQDLSGEDSFLPNTATLATKLGALGINEREKIVLYDQGNQRAASIAWYVFHYLGHEHVFILQGGFPAWLESGGEVTNVPTKRAPTTYKLNINSEVVVTMDDVKGKLQQEGTTLIDARAPKRYQGMEEPTYHKAGHIPGAVNFHAQNVFSATGKWKSQEELKENFIDLKPDDEMIVSCGTGNSACMNVVALKEAGFDNVKLFAGGFSEWISDDENEVATESGK